jgi:hypothetical protein
METHSTKLAGFERTGKSIAVGNRVRILTIPEWLMHDLPDDDVAALKRVQGSIMKILEIDHYEYITTHQSKTCAGQSGENQSLK